MNGSAYDVHPYLLLNYNGQYLDVSTLAHELGHAMHSWFSNRAQPFPTAGYPIFVAEVASTFNEALLVDHMLEGITDPKVRLSVLGNYLEGLRATVFRQTQFAEFELRMHEMAEKGEPITGEALSRLYLDITRRYHGHDAGVCTVDDYVAHEWEFIPHFYSPSTCTSTPPRSPRRRRCTRRCARSSPGPSNATARSSPRAGRSIPWSC